MTFNGTLDLGPDTAALEAFGELGRISPGTDYGMIHGVLHAALDGSTDIPAGNLAEVREQARNFLTEHGADLTEHARWLLRQLSSVGMESVLS